jgi:hypothetical protein
VQELINKIIKVKFSPNELNVIYNHCANTPPDKIFSHPDFGHKAYFSWLPEPIVDKICREVARQIDEPLVLRELSFARYDNTNKATPKLYPHFDIFKEKRITVDIQVESSVDWPLVVDGSEYTLKDGEALVFSGTHQIHWRVHKDFSHGDFVDMIFCHFSYPDESLETTTDEHIAKMKILEEEARKVWYAQQ